jgi:four helix bundle protein
MDDKKKKPIKSFHDLEVYQNSYNASIKVMKNIINNLPVTEKDDLNSQMRRACKAIPRLIAEGYGKRHQSRGFQKYLDDANGESNEMIVNLSHCKDLYAEKIDISLCNELLDVYDKTSRQLYRLSRAWKDISIDKRNEEI